MSTFGKPSYSLPHDENGKVAATIVADKFPYKAHADLLTTAEDHATPAWYYGLPPRPWFEFCL
jgi:hypothetical protein